jgi:hypothetical protein
VGRGTRGARRCFRCAMREASWSFLVGDFDILVSCCLVVCVESMVLGVRFVVGGVYTYVVSSAISASER